MCGYILFVGIVLIGMATHNCYSKTKTDCDRDISPPPTKMLRRNESMSTLPSSKEDLKLLHLEKILCEKNKCAHCGKRLAERTAYVIGRMRGDSLQYCSRECRETACGTSTM